MKEKVWNIPQGTAIPDELLRAGYTPLLAAVFASRGIHTAAAAAAFLDGGSDTPDDPLLLTDIMPAIGRITRARQLGEKAAVYGDYDVDGITAGCLLTDYLRSIGLDTTLYIPDRLEEGYGLNTAAIEKLHEEGVTLIITVDCGVTAIEETEFASSLGVDMIITDHHECQEELPNAVAVVDPKRHDCLYPSHDLAGVGVAFKLVCAMDGDDRRMLERYSDLVAVGTIADVMPLTGENRRIIKAGLEKLRRDPRPGLAALMDEAGVDRSRLGTMTIGFTLAPRINAAGRLGRVEHAARLMMEQNPSRAMRLAAELCEMNRERQRLEQEIWTQAMSSLEGTTPTAPIVLAGEGWHQGVIGIAASRLSEAFCVPAVMISLTDDKGKGSCRSYGGFNLFDALNDCGDLLEAFGGHILAAGLNIRRENVDAFRKALSEYYVNHIPEHVEGLALDLAVDHPELLSMECVESLDLLEPCGNANPRPNLCMLDCVLAGVTPIGGGKHVRLRVEKFGCYYECVWFSHRAEDLGLFEGDRVDLAFYPQINEFRSRRSVQLLVLDIRRADHRNACRCILQGGSAGNTRLSRGELGHLWRCLAARSGPIHCCLQNLPELEPRLHPGKIALGLRVLEEVALAQVSLLGEEIEIMLTNGDGKANLEDSLPGAVTVLEGKIMNEVLEKDFSPEALFAQLSEKVKAATPNADMNRLKEAFLFAYDAHKEQKRKDGSPYVTHAVAATEIAAEMGLDDDALVACLLHDVIEDTPHGYEEVQKRFGKAVADIVEGVTKLTRVQYPNKEEAQLESLRKMLLAMSKDIRVILIKIADRVHNMRTMDYQKPEKQLEKSKETMEIYAPIAHRLGIERFKAELEDRALYYLDRVGYEEINRTLDKRRDIMQQFQQDMQKRITERLAGEGINVQVYGRLKHTYSIYRKMYAQNLGIEEIFDLCAFRVIVSSLADCYNVLGIIHEMFRPVPGRFKDYISTPKPNGYQSLHTTVIGTDGIPFEVQIRTWQMHITAEYGVAAHWKYKTGTAGVETGDVEKFAWIRRLLENQAESDGQDFYHNLKVDMFDDAVFVFTPNGDVKSLPAGATPIDFAYSIHSEVGNRMTGAKANGRIVPLSYILQNGDIVDIITSNASTGPSRDWLKIARSGEARSKIRQWFKREKRDENIVHGKAAFESEWRRTGYTMADILDEEMLPIVLKKLAVTELDDMFASIGYGGMTAAGAVNRIRDEIIRRRSPKNKTELEKIQERADRRQQQQQKEQKAVQGVLVEGLDNCLIKFSRCCTPVPGDPIVGYITRGLGVSIHRQDCINHQRDADTGRWISVSWANEITDTYNAEVRLVSVERNGLIMDVATVLNTLNAKVRSLNARDNGKGQSTASVMLEIKDQAELRNIMNKLGAIHGVTKVYRTGAETT